MLFDIFLQFGIKRVVIVVHCSFDVFWDIHIVVCAHFLPSTKSGDGIQRPNSLCCSTCKKLYFSEGEKGEKTKKIQIGRELEVGIHEIRLYYVMYFWIASYLRSNKRCYIYALATADSDLMKWCFMYL